MNRRRFLYSLAAIGGAALAAPLALVRSAPVPLRRGGIVSLEEASDD